MFAPTYTLTLLAYIFLFRKYELETNPGYLIRRLPGGVSFAP